IEKIEVPADTLPVCSATLFVATIPVPASPSGGHNGTPDSSKPVGSSNFTPSSVKYPAFAPASNTSGKTLFNVQLKLWFSVSALNFSTNLLSYVVVSESIGNIPAASPTPKTFLPVNFQCTYPASVVKKLISFTCSSSSKIA